MKLTVLLYNEKDTHKIEGEIYVEKEILQRFISFVSEEKKLKNRRMFINTDFVFASYLQDMINTDRSVLMSYYLIDTSEIERILKGEKIE